MTAGRRLPAPASTNELLYKALRRAEWGAGHCLDCCASGYVDDPGRHFAGCRVAEALEATERTYPSLTAQWREDP